LGRSPGRGSGRRASPREPRALPASVLSRIVQVPRCEATQFCQIYIWGGRGVRRGGQEGWWRRAVRRETRAVPGIKSLQNRLSTKVWGDTVLSDLYMGGGRVVHQGWEEGSGRRSSRREPRALIPASHLSKIAAGGLGAAAFYQRPRSSSLEASKPRRPSERCLEGGATSLLMNSS